MKEILLTSSVLILALTALRQLLGKHVSKGFQYALWGLVLLRLLIPVQFGSLSFSVTSLAQDSEPIAVVEQQLSQPMVQQDYAHIYERFERQYESQGYNVTSPEVVTQITQETEEFMDLPTWGEILKFFWLVGIGAMAVWFALVNFRFQRSARKNAERLRMESPIPVYVSDGVASPCLTGLIRPVVYLTPACAGDERLCRHALTHELTHYRHGDHIWSILRSLCLCVYWFDPLVWLAAILSRRDCELACDEGALKHLGEHERLSYGRSLVDVVAGDLSPKHLMEAATAMNESKRQITERVNRIVKKPKYYLISTVCLLLATALISGCAFAGSTPTPDSPNADKSDTTADSSEVYIPDISSADPKLLPFPDTDWSMTPDQVIKALDLKDGEYIAFPPEDQYDEYTIGEVYMDLFGETANVCFNFTDVDRNGVFHLYRVIAAYPDTADFNAIQRAMTESYGEPKQEKHLTWPSAYMYTDLMSPDDIQFLATMSQFDQQFFAETPATTITLIINGEIFDSNYHAEATDDKIMFISGAARYFCEGGLNVIKQGENATPVDDPTGPDPTDEDIPEPTGAQPVPDDYTASSLVTTWKEVHLEWENGAGSQEHFDARIPTIYPFSNDAIAINDRIIQKYGAILEENETACSDGYSAYPVSIDYKAYTTAKTLSLVITTDTGHDYIDYEVHNFYLESGEFAQTMDTAAMAKYFLDMSYPEFLWAAKDFTLEYFNTEYADMSEAMREEFNTMHIDLHGMPMGDNPFYLHAFDLFVNENGQTMLRFNAYSMAGADSYPTLAPFFPGSTDKAESYHWLFNIHADGAYATTHDNIFTDAFLADPEEFSHYVSLESEEVIARVAGGIGFEGGVVYADAIREALASLPEGTFKTLTLETLDKYWPET